MLERTQELLSVLAECQIREGDNFGCAPITLKIGGTTETGMVENGVVYLIDACEMVVNTLASMNYHMTVTPHGLRINLQR